MNMSYCRFQNTRTDFQDCVLALQDMLDDNSIELSQDEERAAAQLYQLAQEYIENYERYEESLNDE